MRSSESRNAAIDVVLLAFQRMQARNLDVAATLAAEHGMNATDLRTLLTTNALGPIGVSALATAMGLSLTTVTSSLDRLAAARLVTRERDPGNRRAVVVELTEAGERSAGAIWDVYREIFGGLSAGQLSEAVQVFESVSEAFAGAAGHVGEADAG